MFCCRQVRLDFVSSYWHDAVRFPSLYPVRRLPRQDREVGQAMHKVIFSSIVVVLAGTCWVLAQNASSKPWVSPYGAQRPAAPPPAMLPEEKAELLTVAPGEPLVAPTTELQVLPLPQSSDLPVIPIPLRPSVLPAPRNVVADTPRLPSDSLPIPMPSPNVPLPSPELKPPALAATKPALPGLPPLPPIPGVATSAPMMMGNGSRYDGIVIPQPANPLNPPAGTVWSGAQPHALLPPPQGMEPTVTTQVDPPNYWRDRQRLIDRDERVLGPRVWGGADYLFWFTRPQASPPLIQAVSGVSAGATTFNASQAVTLFPYSDIDYGIVSGVRGTFGFWFNSIQTIGLEGTYMWFGEASLRDGFLSDASFVLGRPFIDATTGGNSLYQVSSPGTVDGLIAVRSTFHLEGGEANFLYALPLGIQLNLLAGFRYLDMNEHLRIAEISVASDSTLSSFDSFRTRNQFWGGQLGLRWNYLGRRLSANVTGKIAYGAMIERATIDGGTTLTTSAGTTTATGGVLALASNIGTYNRTRTAFVPEAVVNLGYRLTSWATVSVGYNFLYSTEVVRPGSQIDTTVNTANLPGGTGSGGRPSFLFKGEDFWVQGVNFGLTLQY